MGTRADFYVGRGEGAKWLGSIAWDGYPMAVAMAVREATDEVGYIMALGEFLAGRDDVTLAAMGWPWPWEDSCTTDYAYAFDGGRVWASCFGHEWFRADGGEPDWPDVQVAVFPKFKNDRAALAGSKRSGIIVFPVEG